MPFGSGISPALNWTAGPKDTKSYALVFKDTTLSTLSPPEPHGYHWAMWNIPASTVSLPQGLGADQHPNPPSASAEQYSGYPPRPFQFLGPCPSWMTALDANVPRSNDHYAFVLYALPTEQASVPAAPTDPAVNWAVALDDYFISVQLGKAELTGTSDAKPTTGP